jgi:ATP-dependent DNA helicase DinG
MARLVARALRLQRGALIQTGTPDRYRLSYLLPMLMWPDPVMVVAPEPMQQHLMLVEIPQLQQWMQMTKPVLQGDCWPGSGFTGLFLTTPDRWLSDRLTGTHAFPPVPTAIDGVDDLETWTRHYLTASLNPSDWHHLMISRPELSDQIRDVRVQLTRAIFQHPPNPYECCLLEPDERNYLWQLYQHLFKADPCPESHHANADSTLTNHSLSLLSPAWQWFWQNWQNTPTAILWATIERQQGQFSLHLAPAEIASALSPLWSQQPVILMGNSLDLDADASIYRQKLGIPDLTCLKFLPDRHHELIQLYLPDRLPLPNTTQYQAALIQEIRKLLTLPLTTLGITVLIVGDIPLKAQVGAILAAEFGRRVQVEKTHLEANGILVTGWEFWRQHQALFAAPQILGIATLPIPSLEHPVVSGRVAYYKQLRQDWFRSYLLPTALNELQQAIAPMRTHSGITALFDSRVIHRSYGKQILSALSPVARINYLDVETCLLNPLGSSLMDEYR